MNNRKEESRKYYLKNKDKKKQYYLDNRERIRNRISGWGKTSAGKESNRKAKLLKHYNMTIEQYDSILKEQNNCCKICSTHESEFDKRLHVDHCHTTGKIRGLLCMACNILLGKAKDNINTLNNAIDYLNNNNSKDN